MSRFFEYTVEKLEVPGEVFGFEGATGNITIFRWDTLQYGILIEDINAGLPDFIKNSYR